MCNFLGIIANIAASLGILICLIAGLVRLSGAFYLAGYEALTLFNGGVGLMVFSCLVKLEVLMRYGK